LPKAENPLPPKLAFTLKELSAELGISKVSIYRLEQRGLLKSLLYLRTKIYTRREVERFLEEGSLRLR
jgi:Zn-dependent peptidase ImmA (M78 family)